MFMAIIILISPNTIVLTYTKVATLSSCTGKVYSERETPESRCKSFLSNLLVFIKPKDISPLTSPSIILSDQNIFLKIFKVNFNFV